MLYKVRHIQASVIRILATNLEARDSDQVLILDVWARQGLVLTQEQREQFKLVSNPESIRRARQKLQEAGRYLPSAKVAKERKLRSYEMQQAIPALKPRVVYDKETNTIRIHENV